MLNRQKTAAEKLRSFNKQIVELYLSNFLDL